MNLRLLAVCVVAAAWLLPTFVEADERKVADVACMPVEHQALVYDCTITLEGKTSGAPIVEAEFVIGADMPSMPGAHNIRPVPAEPRGMPGVYGARIELDMPGEWALTLDFTRPNRDRLVTKLYFGGSHGHADHEN
ncbi:MAG: FixH family protein [bacterium]|nr:FixH family protein [bacterium]